MKLDLYQLCDKKHNKGSIKTTLNKNLKNKIKEALKLLRKHKIKLKDISNQIGIKYSTLWKYLNKYDTISLNILMELENISKINFNEDIGEIVSNHGKVKLKVPKNISPDLARIIGAIVADGHLSYRKSMRGHHYELVIREGHKTNMEALSKWFHKTFDLSIHPKKENNHYTIYISNKIIFKFFNSLIGIPSGKKSDIVSVPNIILKSDLRIKKAFLQGIFMFDGGVDYRTGYVNLISCSKKLITKINGILNEIGIKPDYLNLNPDNFNRYKIRFRKKQNLLKCINLFEQGTEKWFRLREHLYGLDYETKDLKEALIYFNLYYPRIRKNSITFSDVIDAINRLEEADIKHVSKKIKRSKTVSYEFLKKLENCNILSSKRKNLKNIWEINSVIKYPRR